MSAAVTKQGPWGPSTPLAALVDTYPLLSQILRGALCQQWPLEECHCPVRTRKSGGGLPGLSLYTRYWPSCWERVKAKREGQAEDEMLGSITDSTDVSLSKRRQIMKDRGTWHPAVHGVAKSWTQLSDWITATTRNSVAEWLGLSLCCGP